MEKNNKLQQNSISMEDIDFAINVLNILRKEAILNPNWGFDDDWITFNKKMRILTMQSSGQRIQNYIFKAFGWTKISPLLDKGDVKNSIGQYFEVKVSTITSSNPSVNIVQIRLWQKISGHHIFVIDATKNYELTHFSLSKFDMEEEVRLIGTSAHGTKEATKDNIKKEWAIRFNWNDNDKKLIRWKNKYRQDSEISNKTK